MGVLDFMRENTEFLTGRFKNLFATQDSIVKPSANRGETKSSLSQRFMLPLDFFVEGMDPELQVSPINELSTVLKKDIEERLADIRLGTRPKMIKDVDQEKKLEHVKTQLENANFDQVTTAIIESINAALHSIHEPLSEADQRKYRSFKNKINDQRNEKHIPLPRIP